MAPYTSNKMPKSAYHLYFRFCRNILHCPSLMDSINMSKTHRDLYKSYVKMVLYTEVDDPPLEIDVVHQKFFGNNSFAGMSKKVSQNWKESDAFTRSVFKEIAKEDRERYKRELFDSYQSFTKELSTSIPVTAVNLHLPGVQARKSDSQVQVHPVQKKVNVVNNTKKCDERSMNIINDDAHSFLENLFSLSHDRIQEVDMSDEEIIAMAVTVWTSSPDETSRGVYQTGVSVSTPKEDDIAGEEELGDFLLTIDWD